ncbi:GNAT family acetyltraansferase [Photobacterium angustum]|uniref:N-acetyltransferase n=1 Tax=Photobacterium angustum TaxID=661 RepID=A0ABX5H0Q4_PHOAN|nr:GNAT family N-acetyltransferase [Photobacterium angustum]KJG37950.1 GNAT family acetyltraansferase [Photobacterium angustum]PSX06435.1 N-acetyltransferase [Photobacterium angustum]
MLLNQNKIEISQLIESDRCAVFDLLQDKETMRFLGPRRPLTDQESEAWFINEQKAEHRFAFRSIETNEFIGFCGISLIDGELDFGYFLRRKFWGQGLAIIMCESAIAKLSYTIDFTQVNVFIASDNIASQKVAKKLGWKIKCAANNEFETGNLYLIQN